MLLPLIVFFESGCSPVSLIWAIISTYILHNYYSTLYIWILAIFVYFFNGIFLELFPGKRLQPEYSLDLKTTIPTVVLNLTTSYMLTFFKLSNRNITENYACFCLVFAGIGNEIIYAPIHRLLHTKYLYKYHYLHHTQKSPRAIGAVYCTLVEMWIANLSSFVIPLYLLNAPSSIFMIWIISGIQTTQLHHSNKEYFWSFGHQPKFHDDHHKYVQKNYGNLGFFEKFFEQM